MKDLSGDGKITKKDVLIGRGVIEKKKGGMIKSGYMGGGMVKKGYKYGGSVKKKGYKGGGCVMAGRGGAYKGSM